MRSQAHLPALSASSLTAAALSVNPSARVASRRYAGLRARRLAMRRSGGGIGLSSMWSVSSHDAATFMDRR